MRLPSPRYWPEWVGFPRGPWVIRDLHTGRAYTTPRFKLGFWHGTHDQAVKLAERLNTQEPRP